MKPVLYIIMRSDMASMNPGKAMAQASHAANAFVHETKQKFENGETLPGDAISLFDSWVNSTEQGFGTVLVLSADSYDSEKYDTQTDFFYDMVQELDGMTCDGDDSDSSSFIAANIIIDPTYPIRDGSTTHYLEVDTCAYVFVDQDNETLYNEVKKYIGDLELHD